MGIELPNSGLSSWPHNSRPPKLQGIQKIHQVMIVPPGGLLLGGSSARLATAQVAKRAILLAAGFRNVQPVRQDNRSHTASHLYARNQSPQPKGQFF